MGRDKKRSKKVRNNMPTQNRRKNKRKKRGEEDDTYESAEQYVHAES